MVNGEVKNSVQACQECGSCSLFFDKPISDISIEFVSCLSKLKQSFTFEDDNEDISELVCRPNTISFVKSGLIKIYFNVQGKTRIRLVYPGEKIWGPRICESLPRQVVIKAAEPTTICNLPNEGFWELIGSTRDLMQPYLAGLSNSRERMTGEYLIDSCLPTESRLARFLYNDFVRRGRRVRGILTVTDCLSQDEIGLVLGVTRETVSRFLSSFKRTGKISASMRRLSLTKEPELLEVCRFN